MFHYRKNSFKSVYDSRKALLLLLYKTDQYQTSDMSGTYIADSSCQCNGRYMNICSRLSDLCMYRRYGTGSVHIHSLLHDKQQQQQQL